MISLLLIIYLAVSNEVTQKKVNSGSCSFLGVLKVKLISWICQAEVWTVNLGDQVAAPPRTYLWVELSYMAFMN